LTLKSGDTSLTLNFGKALLKKEIKETLSTRFFRKYQDSGQDVGMGALVEHQVTRIQ
jgi:hypothetical protein